MKEKVISCFVSEVEKIVQPLLDDGWSIKFQPTSENICVSTGCDFVEEMNGKIVFVLTKEK